MKRSGCAASSVLGATPALPDRLPTNTMSQSCPVVADSVANASKLAISDGALSTHRQGEMVPPSRRSWRRRCRSEEHTSELQSLMRISYAVFCLKKKKEI